MPIDTETLRNRWLRSRGFDAPEGPPEPEAKPAAKRTNGKAQRAAPKPVLPVLECIHRGEKVGKITCSTLGSPDVFACPMWPVGGCVLRPSPGLSDQPVRTPAGGVWGVGTFSPWTSDSRGEIHRSIPRLPACSLCEHRKTPKIDYPKEIVINSDPYGIGDVALLCWCPEVRHYAHGAKADTVRLFGGQLSETPEARDGTKSGIVGDSWGPELKSFEPRLHYRANWIGASVIRRPPVVLDDEAKAFAKTLREPGRKLIVLIPHSAHHVREWTLLNWIVLATELTRAGYTVAVDASHAEPALAEVCSHLIVGQLIQRMAALVNEADLTISIDTGPAHFAGNMDRPCLLLMGPTITASYAHVPSVTCLTSGKDCTHCNFQSPYGGRCNQGCESLQQLTPAVVLARARKILEARERIYPMPDNRFFSQFGEDKWIDDNVSLPTTGVAVEVGCGPARKWSNTYRLELLGWRTVLIEADRRNIPALRAERRGTVIHAAAVAPGQPDALTFHQNADSTLSGLLSQGDAVTVRAATLDALLAESGVDRVDVLSVDTEGTELDALESFDFERWQPAVVIVEWNTLGRPDASEAVLAWFAGKPYRMAHRTEANLIFVREA